jgi:hypothetical protein
MELARADLLALRKAITLSGSGLDGEEQPAGG